MSSDKERGRLSYKGRDEDVGEVIAGIAVAALMIALVFYFIGS